MRSNSGLAWGIVIGAVVIVGAAVYLAVAQPWKDNDRDADQPAKSSQTTNSTSGEQKKSAVTIVYTDNGFDSSTYTVKKGETVTVTNKSSSDLQFSSDNHPTHTKEPELNMGVLAPGESGTFTPTRTGTWTFHDHLHAEFTGTLTVTD